MSLPINFMGREFAEAELRIVEPAEDKAVIPLHFNPSEYKLKKENTFAEIPIPGLESPPLQYVRGGAEVLSMDLLVDTSGELENVREKYVAKIQALLRKNEKLHAPPIVDFVWAEKCSTASSSRWRSRTCSSTPTGSRCGRSSPW